MLQHFDEPAVIQIPETAGIEIKQFFQYRQLKI